jgi:hypothetical protein
VRDAPRARIVRHDLHFVALDEQDGRRSSLAASSVMVIAHP